MDVIKTYIPKRFRNKKLVNTGSGSGSTTLINSGNDISPSSFVDSDTFYSMFELVDLSGTPAIKAKHEFFSVAGVTAYGTGTVATGGSGSSVSVLDVLNSIDTGSALSANMGRVLNEGKLNRSEISSWALGANKPAYGISEITGLSASLSGKSAVVHKHYISEIYDFAHVHQWSDIQNKPSVFTPDTHTHVKANITDFPSSMPASDVYAWAKASTKPSYVWSEIGSKPTEFTPSAHVHQWNDIGNKPSVITNTTASFTTALETKLNGIATGAEVNVNADWNATSGDALILNKPTSMPASDVYAWAKASTKPSYVWSEIGSKPTMLSGYGIASTDTMFDSKYLGISANAVSATKLVTARTIAGTSFDGTANINISYNNLTNLPSLAFLPLSGGTMTGNLTMGVTTDIITNFNTWTNGNSKSLDKFLKLFDIDIAGNLVVKTNLYSTGEVTAYSSVTGVSGLKLMGDMNANGKSINNAISVQSGIVSIRGNEVNAGLEWDYDGDSAEIASYMYGLNKYVYAGGAINYQNSILDIVGQVKSTEFKFGNYSFKQSANGLSICFNGVEQAYITNTGQYVNS